MSELFKLPPAPKNGLGYHRLLSKSAAVRVSPLCLGAMNFGEAWKQGLGECSKETAFEIMDYFFANGGNFIDTANNYQNGESETWVGEWMKARGNRDQIVLATKFTTFWGEYFGDKVTVKQNFQGNHAKSLKHSVEGSLKKLDTDYIDLLYVHWWDWTTSIPELMHSLHHLIVQGKILYLGISDTPAWVVSKANQYARDHGLTQFSVYQGQWSASQRDFERDIIPMVQDEGMGLAPWGALGGGQFKTEEQRKAAEGRSMFPVLEKNIKMSAALEKVANRKNTLITSVALAYVMHKAPRVFPIVGGRKVEHLKGNIEALSIELSAEDIKEIEQGGSFDVGFPMNMLFEFMGSNTFDVTHHTAKDVGLRGSAGWLDTEEKEQPIKPRPLQS